MPPKRPSDLTPLVHPLSLSAPSNAENQNSNDTSELLCCSRCSSWCGGNETGSALSSSSYSTSGNRHTQYSQQIQSVVITDSMTLVVMDAQGKELRVKDGVFEKSNSSYYGTNGECHCCDSHQCNRKSCVKCRQHSSDRASSPEDCTNAHSIETGNGENLNESLQGHNRNVSESHNDRGEIQGVNYSKQRESQGGKSIECEIESLIGEEGRRDSSLSKKDDSRMDSPPNRANNKEWDPNMSSSCRYMSTSLSHRPSHIRVSSNYQTQRKTTSADPFLNNIRFDDLRIGIMLGKGSQGKVRIAQHRQTQEKYALKYIKFEGDIEAARSVFSAELRRIQALRHENVTTSHEAFFRNNRLCIILDYMDCGTMADIMKGNKGGFPEDMLAYVAKGILSGLRHIHKEKVMHRDIKPANVLVNSDGRVKLSDFGISRRFTGDRSQDFSTETVVGSKPYLCPEMVQNKPYSFGCDIWSAGLTIAECYVGKYPFKVSKNASVFALLEVILKGVDAIDWTGRCGECLCDSVNRKHQEGAHDKECDGDDRDSMAKQTESFRQPPPPSPELQDFVKQCLRAAESRPTADELLGHPFVAKGDWITPEYAGKWYSRCAYNAMLSL
eukprot:Tbor_TRINITY_DN4842_c0_g3::TRINITY_DN4842_c0_g3_i1::g.1355::m.1355